MTNQQITVWALQVIDAVLGGRPNEDDRVELKKGWQDPHRMARTIAGHANASRGEPMLWVIGVDEKKRELATLGVNDPATWYAQVASHFEDGAAPVPSIVNVHQDGKTVVASCFDTTHAPYVVKRSPDSPKGEIALEVPWRSRTETRSAGRNELLRLLVPMQATPRAEDVRCELVQRKAYWAVEAYLYVIPPRWEPVCIPAHRCRATAFFPAEAFSVEMLRVHFGERGVDSPFDREHNFLLREPGFMPFIAFGEHESRPPPSDAPRVSLLIGTTHAERSLELSLELQSVAMEPALDNGKDEVLARWKGGDPAAWVRPA